MDQADKDFERIERNRCTNGDEEGHNSNQNFAGKDVTEETKSEGENLGKIRNELEDTDKSVDGVTKVEKFLEVVPTLEFETVILDEEHGDEGESNSSIEIGGRSTEDGNKNFFVVNDAVKTDGASAGQESRPVAGDDEDEEAHDKREENLGFGAAGDTLDDAIETFDYHL